jgi:phosphate transport system ATP-binding protein
MAKRIDVKDLDIYYGDFKAVEGVTMTVEPRSVTSFIGPSGCGKSTVLRTLNRMHEVIPGGRVDGSVMLDDEDLYASTVDPVAVRRTVGMVFQRPNPFPSAPCRAPTSGTRSRTGSTSRARASRAASSSGCASRAPSP